MERDTFAVRSLTFVLKLPKTLDSDEADVLLDSRGKVNEGQHEKNALVAGMSPSFPNRARRCPYLVLTRCSAQFFSVR